MTDEARPSNEAQHVTRNDERLALNSKTIGELDRGIIGLAIDHALKQMNLDIIERPGDKAKRSVTIKLIGTPVLDEGTAVLDTIAYKVEITQGIPKRTNAKPYHVLPMADGTVVFSPTAAQDPRQLPMFDGTTPIPTPEQSKIQPTPPSPEFINTETGEVTTLDALEDEENGDDDVAEM